MQVERDARLYDFPRYYDLLFGSDWRAEFDFLLGAFELHAARKVRSLFEPACGTGRLLIHFAREGYRVAGNDLNERAVAFCNARLARNGFPASAVVGDMSGFTVTRPADAAFNTINSFRHLQSEAAARNHLECMAAALAPGGIYALGLHLTPLGQATTDEESWSARRGHLMVNSRMWSLEVNRRRRQEQVAMTVDVYTPTKQFRIEEQMVFRTYTARQLSQLLATVPELELVETYDFAYDLSKPILVDGRTEDVVYILRKR